MTTNRKGAPAEKSPPSVAAAGTSRSAAHFAPRAKALASVVPTLQGPLLRFLIQRTGSPEEAKDIIQEAYVRVLSVEREDGFDHLDRYIWRCALNIMSDHRRSSKCRERNAHLLSGLPEQFAQSAEATANTQERLRLITEAIRELPPRCHEAFGLRIIQGLPFDEVGRAMSISSRMAKIYVARSLGMLRTRMDGVDPEKPSIHQSMPSPSASTSVSAHSAPCRSPPVTPGCKGVAT